MMIKKRIFSAHMTLTAICLAGVTLTATAVPPVQAQCTFEWKPSYSVPGMNGYIYAMAVYNGNLIAGGDFTTAGGISAIRIAQWDGNSWSALGSGMNSDVYALAVYDG